MLTSRNAISLTISLAVISLLWTCLSLMRPPDGDGLRADSYGTRGRGQRAVFDTFRELGLPIRRSLGPPVPGKLENARLVLWQPSSEIVRVEQKWLENVGDWVREGGHVLVAVGVEELNLFDPAILREAAKKKRKKAGTAEIEVEPQSLWELLQVPRVSVKPLTTEDSTVENPLLPVRETRDLRDIFQDALKTGQTTSERTKVAARASGVFDPMLGQNRTLSLPENALFQIQFGDLVPVGTITVPNATSQSISRSHAPRGNAGVDALRQVGNPSPEIITPHHDAERRVSPSHAERGNEDKSPADTCIAARFAVGRGEITVVSIPALIENSVIGEADNVVVLSKLLTDGEREIVLDEFYHGLAIRGNPMWLFAQRTYGAVTLTLLLVIGLVVWRESVFLGTPLAERPVSRRAIREYVEAMARFLREGRGAGSWILSKLRDGVLWHLRREHGLPPEQHSEERLLAAVGRRDPDRATELSNTLQAVQSLMAAGQAGDERRAIPLMRRMVECLSKNVTARCAMKSPKSFSDKTT
ncbi:MAG: hypothetical protein IAG10_28045 [Planctomycetaceae bacterium]|nr:hypothetical protein [Planctomycetaceae bacterium]